MSQETNNPNKPTAPPANNWDKKKVFSHEYAKYITEELAFVWRTAAFVSSN